jgi:pimeloyl-ACP methyl ester carboxylesterase
MVFGAEASKEVQVNGVRLQYVEHGSGEPIVFVHGAPHDLRTWEPVREEIAKRYRFIAYTQRYFGTEPWPDEGKNYNIATHADDLAKFIASLNAGPVHLVGWSHGGSVSVTAAVRDPSLVRSLILYEASVISVLPAESSEGNSARRSRQDVWPDCCYRFRDRRFRKGCEAATGGRVPAPARRVRQLSGGFADGAARQRSGCPVDVRSSTASCHHM